MRIPRVHYEPGGFRVITKLVSAEKLNTLMGKYDHGAPSEDSLWVWDEPDGGTIYLDRARSPQERALDYEHEMGHAQVEWRTWWRRKWNLE